MIFKNTQLKITMLYLGILAFITISFSLFVYLGVIKTSERAILRQNQRIEARLKELNIKSANINRPILDKQALSEIKERFIIILILINIFTLALAGSLSYFLAGKTLKPIEDMHNKQKLFISNAAHELKTPLTIIKTDLEVNLRDKKATPETLKNSLQNTITEIDKTNMLIEKLINKARYQTFYQDNKREQIDLKLLIEQLTTNFKSSLENKNIAINLTLTPVILNANLLEIKEVITNLIDNAIKYNSKNGTITITLTSNKNHIILTIEDTGIGISKEDLNNVFDPFYQAKTHKTNFENRGYGLGLSIVKDIIQNYNGTIKISSFINKGTKIQVMLPNS